MEILNVGPLELLLILFLAFVVMGPDRMIDAAGKLGKTIRKFMKSSLWNEITGSYRDLSNFSEEIIRNAGLEKSIKEINELNNAVVEFDDLQTEKEREANLSPDVDITKPRLSQVDLFQNGKSVNRDDENQIQSPDIEN